MAADESSKVICSLQNTRANKIETQVKILYQGLCKLLEVKNRKESIDNSTTAGMQGDDDHEEFTLDEQISFTNKFKTLLTEHMPS